MKRIVGLLLSVFAIVVVACAENVDMGTVKPSGDPSFTPPPGEEDAGADAPTRILACIGTECPAPFATCISEKGPTYKCGTDLMRDDDHCGACGNKCLLYAPIHMTSRCVDGACELECYSPEDIFDPADWRNCNGLLDDGCEVNVLSDAKNCGACGNACADGVPCLDGKCGCPAGKIPCFGMCVDPMNDDNHCGGCGNSCGAPPPDACAEPPPNSYYGCREGKCEQIKCVNGTADCDNDLHLCDGTGCEALNGDDNCGGCGIKCTAPETCVDEGNGPECAVPCAKFGRVLCGAICADLLNDVHNCGACGFGCNQGGPNMAPTCKKGVCSYECQPGFADCNGDPSDGCEVDLAIHPSHCGACGNECNLAAGQPCIEGKCLMVECDPGSTQ